MNIWEFLHDNLPTMPYIVEIGMHHGEDTEKMLELRPKAQIFGFEPDPRCIEVIRNKGLFEKIWFSGFAIGNANGFCDFYQSDSKEGWDLSGSIKEPKEHLIYFPQITFNNKIRVNIIKLDDYLESIGVFQNIDFMWIDTQGAEKDVFLGAKETLKRTKYIHFELYDRREMYKGQPTLHDLIGVLGDNWRIIGDDGEGNRLAENLNVRTTI